MALRKRDPKLLSILFWNVHKKDLTSAVCSLAKSTMADIVVLNENKVGSETTLDELKKNVSGEFYIPEEISEKRFHCFCRNPELDMSEVHSSARTSVRKWKIGSCDALLVLVHGPDMRNNDSAARQAFAHSLATKLRFVQEQYKTKKLVLLGDFNMNPYDSGMNLPTGLNAMMTRACVTRGYRTDEEQKYDFYYNPMWSLFGDNTEGPAGTIHSFNKQGPYGWSMLDQVVVHHSIVSFFRDVKILTKAGEQSLKNNMGRPDAQNASDHFPIHVNFCGDNHG